VGAIARAFVFDQVGEGAADDFLEGSVEEFRETTIGGTDLAVETESQKDVVERVDEVAKALLRPGNHLEKLIELAIARQPGFLLVEASHQAF
jgi:hypothetical protein